MQSAVLGERQSGTAPASTTPPASAVQAHEASASGSLPFSGSDVMPVLLAGCLLLLSGLGMRVLLARLG
jgi:hypothetical protein